MNNINQINSIPGLFSVAYVIFGFRPADLQWAQAMLLIAAIFAATTTPGFVTGITRCVIG